MALAHVDGQAARAIEEDPVEDLARNGERVVAIATPPSLGRVPAGERSAAGRDDAHAGQRLGARGIHVLQDAEAVEHPRGFGREVLAADLRARKLRPVEQDDTRAALGEQDGRRRAGGAGPHDHHVGPRDHLLLTTHCRKSAG